ncbi:MAG TPA: haloacid dehalogenase-like hydrolase [Patescibacteria group bacterium]|nr:haloacid dehalogenase-like hydrolase [Patescibacteria group bacterium]
MSETPVKNYLFASDFDQTLTFNDSGYALSEIVGIPTDEFKRKAEGMARLNLVQQGAELAYLLLHDPEFKSRVRREHLREVGKRIRLKDNIGLLYEILDHGIPGYHFEFSILSAAPVEVIQSALDGIVPADRIYGTEFSYTSAGEIDRIVRATAGYGKVTRLDQLQENLQIGADHVIYAGDGSSDIHVMLHVNARDGLTISVSERRSVANIAQRTVLGASALVVLVPILEMIAGWKRPQIRSFIESYGFLTQEWDSVRTDWLTLRPALSEPSRAATGA